MQYLHYLASLAIYRNILHDSTIAALLAWLRANRSASIKMTIRPDCGKQKWPELKAADVLQGWQD